MSSNNAFYRKRNELILSAFQSGDTIAKYAEAGVNNDRELLAYGVARGEFSYLNKDGSFSYLKDEIANSKLGLVDLMTFNTWFLFHPEKVCGEEVVTSSIYFPVTIKGTQADVEAAIDRTIKGGDSAKRIEVEKAKLKLKIQIAAAVVKIKIKLSQNG